MYTPTVILTTLFAATVATAATLQPRQIGNLACNAARLGVVGALNDAGDAVSQIQDPDTQAAAQAGLDQANDGVQQVAQSIFSGEKASADGRDGVAAGLQAMTDALASGDSADPAIADTQDAVDKATTAGEKVVSECV